MSDWTPERHAAARARCEAATPGPWVWRGNGSEPSVWLISRARGAMTVMTFRRWGMQGGQPVFQVKGMLRAAKDLLVRPEPHNPWKITDIDHPDAQFIAHARQDVPDMVEEIEQLQARLAAAENVIGAMADSDPLYEAEHDWHCAYCGAVNTLERALMAPESWKHHADCPWLLARGLANGGAA